VEECKPLLRGQPPSAATTGPLPAPTSAPHSPRPSAGPKLAMGVSGSGVSLPPIASPPARGINTFNTSMGLPQRAADVAGAYTRPLFRSN